jgi:hypothetical protein
MAIVGIRNLQTAYFAERKEADRLRAALTRIADYPQDDMFVSLAPAVAMRGIARDALGSSRKTAGA